LPKLYERDSTISREADPTNKRERGNEQVSNFTELHKHYGHQVVVAQYTDIKGEPVAVAIECMDCYEVLVDYDNEEVKV
jgi:hypothetical protein